MQHFNNASYIIDSNTGRRERLCCVNEGPTRVNLIVYEHYRRVHSRGAVNGCQFRAGSGGSQGLPSMAARMASRAVMPWAAAESR